MVLSGFIDGGESKNLPFEGRKWFSGRQVRYLGKEKQIGPV
jgi:hypothetical protein